jgi:hypothetical protein
MKSGYGVMVYYIVGCRLVVETFVVVHPAIVIVFVDLRAVLHSSSWRLLFSFFGATFYLTDTGRKDDQTVLQRWKEKPNNSM